jgi:very-short-patch-repair endonuclease
MLWPEFRLVVELDGFAFHHTRAKFEDDRARDAALQLAGYRVIRITHRMLVERPDEVVVTLRALLSS